MSNKDTAVAIMQEYFPNGGRDYDSVCALLEAILAGNIPHVSFNAGNDFEATIRPVIKYLAENHHPHTHIVVTSTDAELSEGVQAVSTDEYLKD
ncbi:hypothetical protein [Pectobacterium versatile]|uniref:hypothetical protein n=1 Tax=Pectobacterium versatile TaxID=2488639 RepID=UPI00102E9805|nr:hypothetical protein [Pectobacterium versatile]TAI99817.1 hypothetical protein EG332_04205 [Pectobacterium versatile]UEQ10469.1 hypothetical protein LLE50_04990 [Pectobacterium versatile]